MKTNYKRIIWLFLTILFVALVIRIANFPSAYGFWFPFLLSFIFCAIGVSIGGIIIAGILRLILKKKLTFWSLFSISSIIIIIGLHIYFHFPPLKIIVPDNYTGEVNLVVHPNNEKKLTIDSNGIGYITESIYINSRGDKKPNVYYQNGEKISSERIIGYDSLFFYRHGNLDGRNSLKFKIRQE